MTPPDNQQNTSYLLSQELGLLAESFVDSRENSCGAEVAGCSGGCMAERESAQNQPHLAPWRPRATLHAQKSDPQGDSNMPATSQPTDQPSGQQIITDEASLE